jgi:hypothetical protein
MEDLKSSMDLAIPDGMLGEFLSKFPYKFLQAKETNYFDVKRKVFIEYQQLTYAGTIDNHYTMTPSGLDHKQLTIKLCHDGFVYSRRKYKACNLLTHDMGSWYMLGKEILKEILKEMPNLKKFISDIESCFQSEEKIEIEFFYNIQHRRIDIKFFKQSSTIDEPFILITFEKGNPVDKRGKSYRFDIE